MTPPFKKFVSRRYRLGLAAACLIMAAAFLFWGPAFVEDLLNRQELGPLFSEATGGGTFASGRLRVHFFPIPHAVVPDGRITIPERLEGKWETARIYPAFAALLTGQLRIGSIVLQRPDLAVHLPPPSTEEGAATPPPEITGHLQQQLLNWQQQVARIGADADIEIRDATLQVTGLVAPPLSLADFDLDLHLPDDQLEFDLHCRSNYWENMRLSGALQATSLSGHFDLMLRAFNPSLVERWSAIGPARWASLPMDLEATADLTSGQQINATVISHIPALQLQGQSAAATVEGIRIDTSLDYSPGGLRIHLKNLSARQPSLVLTGQADFNPQRSTYQVDLTGRRLSVDALREAALAVAGENETVAGIFDVLRGGRVPRIHFSTRGRTPGELAAFDNMTITGALEQGRLFIPGADLDLNGVDGKADIANGILKGSDLNAVFGHTTGTRGKLWLDLGHDDAVPFFLEIDVEADLGPLPERLGQWVEDPAFQEEMRRIRNVRGRAQGMLVLDGRDDGLDVTVDVSQCRFDAAYDRLPAPLSISKGMVQFTRDRIQTIGLSGQIGRSSFNALTAHIVFGETPLLQVDSANAHIDLQQVAPWLDGIGAFEALPFRVTSDNGWIDLDNVALEGPVFNPARWRVTTRGVANRLSILSKDLPGTATVQSARFKTEPGKLDVTEAHVLMSDADLKLSETGIHFKDHSVSAGNLTFRGQIGRTAATWIGDRIDLGEPWRLKPPVTVSTATLRWSAEGTRAFRGSMTTGGGTRLSIDVAMADGRLQHQKLVVDDQDSRAELEVAFTPDHLDIAFEGRFSSATLQRMMQEAYQHRGHMEGRFQARIYPQRPGNSSVSGVLKAQNFYQPLRLAQRHHIETLSLEARANQVHIAPSVIVIEDQRHRLSGSIAIENDGYVLDLEHAATNLSLTPPETPDAPPAPQQDAFSLWQMPLRGRIVSRLDRLTLGHLTWMPFNAVTHIDADNWHCRIEEAALCGISTPGTIRIGRGSMSIAIAPQTTGQSFDRTMTCLMEMPDLIDGHFDLDGRLEAEGLAGGLDRAIDGSMSLEARKGRIYRFNLLSKALAVVNVTEIFRGKLPDLMKDGLAYESMTIRVDIEDSLCTIREAVIDGASANIAGQGTINLVTGETDMIVLVAPFKTVDALVRYTPIIGEWLGGTLISIPVRVSGNFSDPNVTPLSPSAVGSSLMNLMKKTVGLPIKLVTPFLKQNE